MITLEQLHEAMEYYGITSIKRTEHEPIKEGISAPESVTQRKSKQIKNAQYDIALIKKIYGNDVVSAAAKEIFER